MWLSYLIAHRCWRRTVNNGIGIHDFIFRSVHVQQRVELGEAGGFGGQVFFVGEGLVHGGLGFFELPAGVGQAILRVLQAGGQALGDCLVLPVGCRSCSPSLTTSQIIKKL